MDANPTNDLDMLIDELRSCPEEQLEDWILRHRDQLSLDLLQRLQEYSTAHYTLSNPKQADRDTRRALAIAKHMLDEPLAMLLACWARGNWMMFYAPAESVELYRRALEGYRAANDVLSVARLLGNLIGVLTDCGRFDEAEQAYREARTLLLALEKTKPETKPIYRLRLEQNYGWLRHCQGLYADALGAYEQALYIAQEGHYPAIAAEIQVNRTLTLGMLGRMAEGEAILLHQQEIARLNQQWLTVARIDMNLGELYAALGRPAAALSRFHQARSMFASHGNLMEIGSVRMREGSLFQRIGAWREARHSYTEALGVFTQHEMWSQVAQTLVYAATASRLFGDFEQSSALIDKAEELWRELEQPLWLTIVQLERIALALDQEDASKVLALITTPLPIADNLFLNAQYDLLASSYWRQFANDSGAKVQARQACRRALRYAEAQGDRWMQRKAQIELGNLWVADDVEKAYACLEKAVALDTQLRQAFSAEELKASFLQAHSNDLFPTLIRLAVEQGEWLRALSYVWQLKAGGLLDLLQTIADEESPSAAEQVELDQIRQRLATQRWILTMESGLKMPDYLRERTDATVQELELSLQEMRWQRRRRQGSSALESFAAPEKVLENMDADALLEYVICDDEILGIYMDRAGNCQSTWLCESETILDLLADLHLNFHDAVSQPLDQDWAQRSEQWQADYLPLLKECYDLLLAPFHELQDDQHLLIAPCAPLFQIPFAALWDGQRYLVERCQVEMIPSGGLLSLPFRTTVAGSSVIVAASAGGSLTAARREAEEVAAFLPDSVTLIEKPNSIAYLAGMVSPRVLHIAAHTVIREDAPLFSAVELTQELLSVEQCYELNLAGTELVTLSGCRTVAGMDTGGALLAFQSACFAAGARWILSSLWPIQDEATPIWMGHFYRRFAQEGNSPSEALRKTQRSLLQDPVYRHPALWAAFACYRR